MTDSVKYFMCTNSHNESDMKDFSKIVLAALSLKDSSIKSLRVYAILYEQTNSSFADPKIAEYFDLHAPVSENTLLILHGSTSNVQGMILSGLYVNGVTEKKICSSPSLYQSLYP